MTPLLLSLLIYAVAGKITDSPCQDVTLGSCEPDPSSILHQKQGVTVQDCQLLCTIFSSCTIFQHQEKENHCTLFSADYRLDSCSTITSPTFRPGEDNIFSACQEALAGNPNTCDGFIEETCIMDTDPQGDILPGEISNPEDCSHICSIENYTIFSFTLAQESTCSCFSSSSRTCSDLGGPIHPDLESCADNQSSTTATTTTTGPANTDVILITGGVVPGILPGLTPPHNTGTTEVIGSYCQLPDLPNPDSEYDEVGAMAPGHLTVLTPDFVSLTCGGTMEVEACFFLDVDGQQWVPHSTPPIWTYGSSAVTLEDGVYMMGFLDFSSSGGAYNYYLHLPVGSTQWEKKPLSEDLSLSIYAGSCSVVTSASTFLVIGFTGPGSQVLEYNSRDSSWTPWASLAEERYGHSCTLLVDDVVIVGGIDPNDQDHLAKTSTTLLNIKTRQERRGGDMLTARVWFGLIMIENQLMAMGGSDAFQENADVVLFTEVWNDETETWTATDSKMTTPRAGFGHAIVPLTTVCP